MPGKGKIIERDYTAKEREAIAAGAAALGLSENQALTLLGERTLDVYLNNLAYWKNIPLRVWEYTIGGYQVIKKWLSYREREILERALSMDEARAVTDIARRVTAPVCVISQLAIFSLTLVLAAWCLGQFERAHDARSLSLRSYGGLTGRGRIPAMAARDNGARP